MVKLALIVWSVCIDFHVSLKQYSSFFLRNSPFSISPSS